MFVKASALIAVFAVAAQVVVATPPACVLKAINTQEDPSDFKTVCGSDDVVAELNSDNCGNNLETAQTYFADYCKAAGVQVAESSSESSSSATKSSSGSSHSATQSASETGSSSESESTSGTTDSASSPSGTRAASYPVGTGFVTATTNGSFTASAPTVSGTVPSQTDAGVATSTGGAARLGMDLMGMAALGAFGAMLAM